MKLLVIGMLVGVCLADRLDNTYLPPARAYNAGGSSNFLSTPRRTSFGTSHFGGSSFGSSTGSNFGGFSSHQRSSVSQAYGAPSAHSNYQGGFGGGQSYHGNNQVPILRLNNDNDGLGNYRYEYETGDGIQAQEQGQNDALNVQGSYTYTSPDGQQITVHYTADENGFHPEGAHLPTPPPIPEAILKSIQYNAQHHRSSSNSYNDNSGNYDHSSGSVAASRQYLAQELLAFLVNQDIIIN